ncbi:MAG TPA: hypothetical protein ENF30_01295 [Candidatus Desulfofervidus auxilii]|uniref:Yip1 domain-containing protein n=1 Tax=Desulfofervidus auxilii TaxID=1621989 RepID=A0A7V0I9W0_DESA2|nr:hypothetical protein [Candidatus Desulfofervidus auxilii]
MEDFAHRILRAIRLEAALYEEVKADESALPQAVVIVILSSIAGGLGEAQRALFLGIAISLISWFIWAYFIYIIGTKWLPEYQTQSNLKGMLRVLGFASAPGILRIFSVILPIRKTIFFITTIWTIIAMIVAVRQALNYKSTARAAIVCFIAWLAQAMILGSLLALMMKGH